MFNTIKSSLFTIAAIAVLGTTNLNAAEFLWTENDDIQLGILSVSTDENLGAPGGSISIAQGTLMLDTPPGKNLQVNRPIVIQNGTLAEFYIVNDKSNAVLSGPISGMGSKGLIKSGPGSLMLTGSNTYMGGTEIREGALGIYADANLGAPGTPVTISNGTLFFNNDPKHTIVINRPITIQNDTAAELHVTHPESVVNITSSIQGQSAKGSLKTGPGTVIFNKENTYSGLTYVNEGAILANSITLPKNVQNEATVTIIQNMPGTYEGTLSGNGILNIRGNSPLKLTGNCTNFNGLTNVQEGKLSLNTTLGSHVIVQNGGHLSGNGKILGNLLIGANSTIAPGNSIGTLVVIGDYTQTAGSIYAVQFNGAGQSSLIDVSGIASVNGIVTVESVDKTYDFSKTYTILEADGGVSGAYANASVITASGEFPFYNAILSYTNDRVLLNMTPAFINGAKTINQRKVAKRLDTLTNATASQLEFLNEMPGLTTYQLRHTLNQVSGQQHTADIIQVELLNRQFIRRLYNPLRTIIGSDPRIKEWYELEKECNCYPCGIDVWFGGSGIRTSQKGNSNCVGFKVEGGEFTVGAQKTFDHHITAGVAGSYEYDNIEYHLGGSGGLNSFLGGVYGVYRPACFYVLADIAYGFSFNNMKRPIEVGNKLKYHAKSTPHISQLTCYSEFGGDYLWQDLLIQPFVGVEVANFWRDQVKEHGAGDLNMTINKRKRTATNTRLGFHLNAPNLPSDFNLYIDLAWIYRWTSRGNNITTQFDTFGTNMLIHGLPLYHSNFEGTLAVTKEVCDCWEFFAEFSGQFWKRSCSYYVLGGFECKW